MAVPVASRLRRCLPDSYLAWAVESRCADVVDTESLVDFRAEFPRGDWSRRAGLRDWFTQFRSAFSLRKVGFDLGLDLQGHSKTALVLKIARPKKALAVRAADGLVRRLVPVMEPQEEGLHTVEVNLRALSLLTDCDADASPIMPRLEAERRAIRVQIGPKKPLATIAVSAGSPEKSYPLEGWAAVADALQEGGFQVAYLGGPKDLAPQTANRELPFENSSTDDPSEISPPRLRGGSATPQRRNAATPISLVGQTKLSITIAWVAESSLHLAADTGTGHLAAAYGIPVVSIFGPKDPRVFRPYTHKGIVLRESDRPGDVAPEKVVEAALAMKEGHVPALPR